MKTSEQWNKEPEFSNITILDPDGWDRTNYQFSWFEEQITKEEFEKRMFGSTCIKYNNNNT